MAAKYAFEGNRIQGTYLQLSNEIHQGGLLDRQYTYYALKILGSLFMLCISISVIIFVDNTWIQMGNAIFLAFIITRFGMLMHDANHNQIFKSSKFNAILGLFIANVVMHSSSDSWKKNHNKHHSSPNTVDEDPDIAIPFLVYSEKDAIAKKGIIRHIAGYQAFYWFILMSFSALSIRKNYLLTALNNMKRNISNRQVLHYFIEIFFALVGIVWYYALIIYFIGGWNAFYFIVLNYAVLGLYMGTVFATNHKGMPLLNGPKPEFMIQQIMTSRNVKGSLMVDYWTGGLNYQIEHHLFPSMPRKNLSKAAVIVKKFCRDNNIEYYETGFFQSYKEILQNFHQIGTVLRQQSAISRVTSFSNKRIVLPVIRFFS